MPGVGTRFSTMLTVYLKCSVPWKLYGTHMKGPETGVVYAAGSGPDGTDDVAGAAADGIEGIDGIVGAGLAGVMEPALETTDAVRSSTAFCVAWPMIVFW